MRKNSKVLGCCGVTGITNVEDVFNDDMWNRSNTAFNRKVDKFKRQMVTKFGRSAYGARKVECAAVQFNLADWQAHAIEFFDTLPFIRVELGRNPNTGAEIFTYFAPREKLINLLDQWEEEIKQADKPAKPLNPFVGVR